MSTLSKPGDAHTAPEYSSSHYTPNWSGLPDDRFTSDLICELKLFIQSEARRLGHNDANSSQVGITGNLFHPSFLEGWPHRMWEEHYRSGTILHRARVTRKCGRVIEFVTE